MTCWITLNEKASASLRAWVLLPSASSVVGLSSYRVVTLTPGEHRLFFCSLLQRHSHLWADSRCSPSHARFLWSLTRAKTENQESSNFGLGQRMCGVGSGCILLHHTVFPAEHPTTQYGRRYHHHHLHLHSARHSGLVFRVRFFFRLSGLCCQ